MMVKKGAKQMDVDAPLSYSFLDQLSVSAQKPLPSEVY